MPPSRAARGEESCQRRSLASGQCRFSTLFVCLPDEHQTLAAAFSLRRVLKTKRVQIVAAIEHEGGVGAVLDIDTDVDRDSLEILGILDKTCTIDIVTNTTTQGMGTSYCLSMSATPAWQRAALVSSFQRASALSRV